MIDFVCGLVQFLAAVIDVSTTWAVWRLSGKRILL